MYLSNQLLRSSLAWASLLTVCIVLAWTGLSPLVVARQQYSDLLRGKEATSGTGSGHRNQNGGSDNKRRHRKLAILENVWKWVQDWNIFNDGRTDGPYEQVYTDVIIIGAGAAGIAAALELQQLEPDLDYIILESTDRVGGRVRKHTMGAPGRDVTVEDGANWIVGQFNSNPIWTKAEDLNMEGFTQNFFDWTVYDANGSPVDPNVVQAKLNSFMSAFNDAGKDADEQYDKDHESFNDQGIIALLQENGWTVSSDTSGNLDYIMQWVNIDYEYAVADSSVRGFPYAQVDQYFVTDQRGYETVLQDYSKSIPADRFRFNTRVTDVWYDMDICLNRCAFGCLGTTYKVRARTENKIAYNAQRIILTVSTGVINNDLIRFRPPLAYPVAQNSPFGMAQYIKVFYQFETKFWDDTEFVEITRNPANRGKCNHWQNMERAIAGSGIIRCELMTEAFLELIDPSTQELSAATLDSLLDPLRAVYGNATVGTPIDVYYPKLNLDKDFGYGAYSYWKIGKTFTDYAKFFGGVNILTDLCGHNGCNDAGEWVMHISGAASCFEYYELVNGAFFSGQRSARFVLESLGYEDIETDSTLCDISFEFLG